MTPAATLLLPHVPTEWTGTKEICLSAGLTYPGDGSANHNLAYAPLNELLRAKLVEKRKLPRGHARYTQYRRVAP